MWEALWCLLLSVFMSMSHGWNLSALAFNDQRTEAYCKELRQIKFVHTIESVIFSSGLTHLLVVADSEDQVLCSHNGCIPIRHETISCANWSMLDYRYHIYLAHRMMTNILIDCTNTEQIIEYLIGKRGSNPRKLVLRAPFYNIMTTRHVQPRKSYLQTGNLKGSRIITITPGSRDQSCIDASYRCPPISYEVHEVREVRRIPVGYYTCRYHGNAQIFNEKVTDLRGIHLHIATEPYNPFVIRQTGGRYSGYCIEFLEMISDMLNFSYDLTRSVDRKFGVKEADGSWNGLIGMMNRQEVDMVVTGLTITSHREEVVDFTLPVWEEKSAVLVTGIENDFNWSHPFAPLDTDVWITTGITLLVLIFVYTVLDMASQDNTGNETSEKISAVLSCIDSSTLKRNSWFTLGIGLRQDVGYLPLSRASRLVSSSVWLGMLILAATYCANLTASLSIKTVVPPLNSLRDLANNSDYTIMLNGGSVHRLLFEESKASVFADLWEKIESTRDKSLVSSTTIALKSMFNDSDPGKYAVIADLTSIQTKLGRDYGDRCNWAFIPEMFFKSGFGFALPEGSPYKELFDDAILRVWQSGMDKVWKERFFTHDLCGITKGTVNSEAKPIILRDILAVVFLAAFGLGLSLLCFMLEHLVDKGKAVILLFK